MQESRSLFPIVDRVTITGRGRMIVATSKVRLSPYLGRARERPHFRADVGQGGGGFHRTTTHAEIIILILLPQKF